MIIPFCKNNYKTETKLATFGFPKDEEVRKKFIAAWEGLCFS